MAPKKGNIIIGDQSLREDKFKKIYEAYFERLYAYTKVICRSDELAQDLVSDLFYQLWKNETDFDDIHDLEAYLFVSAKNQAIRAVVKDMRLVNHEFLEIKEKSVEYLNPEHLLLEKELRTRLNASIQKLPDQCQLIFKMAREQGLKYREIAKELDISTETVKTQLSKAQKQLKADIVKFYNDNGKGIPDVRLIGQWLFLIGINNCDIINL